MMRACLAAASLALFATAAHADTTLRVGNDAPASMVYCALNVGLDQGLFQKHGLTIEAADLFGATKGEEAMVSGTIDILLGSGSEMRFIPKGVPELAVAVVTGPPSQVTLIVRKNAGIQSLADLKGRTLAVTTAGSLSDWLAHEIQRRQGWPIGTIKLATMGSNAAEVAALVSGQADGTIVETAIAYTLEERGQAQVLAQFGKILPDYISLVIFASRSLIDQHPDQLRGFLAAWFEAEDVMRTNKDAVVACAASRTGASPSVVARTFDTLMPDVSRDGHFSPQALRLLAQSFVDMGQLPAPPDPTTLYTEAFLPGAR